MDDEKMDPAALDAALGNFTGGDEWFKHQLGLLYTSGVHFLAEKAGAYWLIDAIASWQKDRRLRTPELREFQLWTLHVNADRTAVLSCYADEGRPAAVQQEIEFSDFPLESIRLYVENGTILLPSEH